MQIVFNVLYPTVTTYRVLQALIMSLVTMNISLKVAYIDQNMWDTSLNDIELTGVPLLYPTYVILDVHSNEVKADTWTCGTHNNISLWIQIYRQFKPHNVQSAILP